MSRLSVHLHALYLAVASFSALPVSVSPLALSSTELSSIYGPLRPIDTTGTQQPHVVERSVTAVAAELASGSGTRRRLQPQVWPAPPSRDLVPPGYGDRPGEYEPRLSRAPANNLCTFWQTWYERLCRNIFGRWMTDLCFVTRNGRRTYILWPLRCPTGTVCRQDQQPDADGRPTAQCVPSTPYEEARLREQDRDDDELGPQFQGDERSGWIDNAGRFDFRANTARDQGGNPDEAHWIVRINQAAAMALVSAIIVSDGPAVEDFTGFRLTATLILGPSHPPVLVAHEDKLLMSQVPVDRDRRWRSHARPGPRPWSRSPQPHPPPQTCSPTASTTLEVGDVLDFRAVIPHAAAAGLVLLYIIVSRPLLSGSQHSPLPPRLLE